MIYFLILFDILINNYSRYTSFFFIIYLYNKNYKYYLITGLILDFIIFKTYYINIIILSIIYLLNMLFNSLNKNNIYNYVFINIFNYMMYIILSNLTIYNNLNNILLILGNNLSINIIFYILSYSLYKYNNHIIKR